MEERARALAAGERNQSRIAVGVRSPRPGRLSVSHQRDRDKPLVVREGSAGAGARRGGLHADTNLPGAPRNRQGPLEGSVARQRELCQATAVGEHGDQATQTATTPYGQPEPAPLQAGSHSRVRKLKRADIDQSE